MSLEVELCGADGLLQRGNAGCMRVALCRHLRKASPQRLDFGSELRERRLEVADLGAERGERRLRRFDELLEVVVTVDERLRRGLQLALRDAEVVGQRGEVGSRGRNARLCCVAVGHEGCEALSSSSLLLCAGRSSSEYVTRLGSKGLGLLRCCRLLRREVLYRRLDRRARARKRVDLELQLPATEAHIVKPSREHDLLRL